MPRTIGRSICQYRASHSSEDTARNQMLSTAILAQCVQEIGCFVFDFAVWDAASTCTVASVNPAERPGSTIRSLSTGDRVGYA
eukprot:2801642-Rhodomonas_salina.1